MRQRAGLSSESVQRSGELIGRRPGEVQVVSGGIGGRRRKEPRSLETGGFEDLCLLFIHPRAPNLISLRSASTTST